jgi:signal transduction histidine kinase
MKIDFNSLSVNKEVRFKNLSKRYILALGSVAALIIVGQLVVQIIIRVYESNNNIQLVHLQRWEFIFFSIMMVMLIIIYAKVVKPTNRRVEHFITQLQHSEQNAKKLSKEIGAVYNSLENSYEELSQVNLPVESFKLYAKTDRGGNVTFINEVFAELIGKKLYDKMTLQHLFSGYRPHEDWIDEVIDEVSNDKKWSEEIEYTDQHNMPRYAQIRIIPVKNETGEIYEWMVLGADITLQKIAEESMHSKNKSAIEKKINQQKFRSVLILEGQEEERKRLAMDIHDGIGQMLTSLKFQIESVDLEKPQERVIEKLADVKHLLTETIKEVRRVTFNLKPTVLGDYGLMAAISMFLKEVGKVSDVKLQFNPTPGLLVDLPQKVENNVFRIVQEAVNNAIKYSQASAIEVGVTKVEKDIIITISDNGLGFDEKIIESRSVYIESGRGFFNMYERTEYINGGLEIKSKPSKGTKVILSIPVIEEEKNG